VGHANDQGHGKTAGGGEKNKGVPSKENRSLSTARFNNQPKGEKQGKKTGEVKGRKKVKPKQKGQNRGFHTGGVEM